MTSEKNKISEEFRQAVTDDLYKFVDDTVGRPGYSPGVQGDLRAMTVVAHEIIKKGDQISFVHLDRMINYMIDVYDQGICFSKLQRRYKDDVGGEDKLYLEIRKKTINRLNQFIYQKDVNEYYAFESLFQTIVPSDFTVNPLINLKWKILYGEDRKGILPIKMPILKKVKFIQSSLSKIN